MNNTLVEMINPELLFLGYEAVDKNEMLEGISDWLYEKGYVNKEFKRSIMEREKLYPTGLKLDEIEFAIPHTDADYVIKPGVVLVQLKDRVEFTQMATFDDKIHARIAFILLMHKDGSQVALLQDIIGRCSSAGFVAALEQAKTADEVMAIIKND